MFLVTGNKQFHRLCIFVQLISVRSPGDRSLAAVVESSMAAQRARKIFTRLTKLSYAFIPHINLTVPTVLKADYMSSTARATPRRQRYDTVRHAGTPI